MKSILSNKDHSLNIQNTFAIQRKQDAGYSLTDNRPVMAVYRNMQQTADSSMLTSETAQLQSLAENSERSFSYDTVPDSRQSALRSVAIDPNEEVLQGVFVYSFLGDKIIENDNPKSYYEKLNFQQVTANGLNAMSDPRNVDRAKFLLKVMSYQELEEEVPAASAMNRPSMGGHDAIGIWGIVKNITTAYPPGKFLYLFPGASGDLIAMAVQNMAGVPVYRLALSDIGVNDLKTLKQDQEKYQRFRSYMYKSIGGILKSKLDVVIIDAVDKGNSLLTLSSMIQFLDQENEVNRKVEMMSLNVTKSALKEMGINEVEHHDENENFVKYRIYWQQYKEKVPRILPKTPIKDILSGKISDPPKLDADAYAKQSEEIYAMILGLWKGQYKVTEKENLIRALMLQLGMSRAKAIEELESEDDDSGEEWEADLEVHSGEDLEVDDDFF